MRAAGSARASRPSRGRPRLGSLQPLGEGSGTLTPGGRRPGREPPASRKAPSCPRQTRGWAASRGVGVWGGISALRFPSARRAQTTSGGRPEFIRVSVNAGPVEGNNLVPVFSLDVGRWGDRGASPLSSSISSFRSFFLMRQFSHSTGHRRATP